MKIKIQLPTDKEEAVFILELLKRSENSEDFFSSSNKI
jgi:hypothetical protein